MKKLMTIVAISFFICAKAQKVDSIYINLYTDSLKKGTYNYINVDGQLSNGSFIPLMADEVIFKSSIGSWQGNSLILDPATKEEKVSITVTLKANPRLSKMVVIFFKKITTDPVLKSEKEIIEGYKKNRRRTNKN
jgi:hypothetical protein